MSMDVRPSLKAVLLAVLTALCAIAAVPANACDPACQARIDKLANDAKARNQSVARGINNTVVVQHGAGIPVLKCRALHLCTIQLQPGEVLREGLALGDTVLWSAELRVSGTEIDPLVRIVVKPDEAATQTSLVIATDRRFYDIQLVRSDTEYTPVMAFAYPADEAAATRAKIAKEDAQRLEQETEVAIEEARQSIKVGARDVFAGDLDFGFDIRGKAPFRPTRVFTDGRKTWIDLPDRYRGERPIFLADGTGKTSQAVVNTRWNGNRLEIDRVITGGALVVGVGRKAQKIIIRRASR